jgi:hypothetical protein
MPHVVKVDVDEPGCVERRAPDAREAAAAELGTFRASEDQIFGSRAGEVVQVLGDIGQQERRDGNPANTSQRFGRPGYERRAYPPGRSSPETPNTSAGYATRPTAPTASANH